MVRQRKSLELSFYEVWAHEVTTCMTNASKSAAKSSSKSTVNSPRGDPFLHVAINGWPLFWLLAVPMSAFMLATMLRHNLGSAQGVSHMIQYSVRWAVPFIYIVVAASAMPRLLPCAFTRWWQRNRRYTGLVFAVAMAWQGAFIFMLSNLHSEFYYADVYALRDELEGSSGYLFLGAMVLTSFRVGRQALTARQWKLLHTSGMYFLWAYPFSVYWWNLYYYQSSAPLDYIFYWAGFMAFAARIAAWGKRRADLVHENRSWAGGATRSVGIALIGAGLAGSATGAYWQTAASAGLTSSPWSAQLQLWLPFWPFEPFLPLIALGLGAWLYTGGLIKLANRPAGASATR